MKRLLVLAGVLLAVALVVWLDRDRPTTDQIKKTTEQLFPGLDPGRIDHLVIDRLDGRGPTHIELIKKAGWWLADGTRADDAAVEPILSTLTYGRVERLVSTAQKLDRAHLVATGKDLTLDLRLGEDAAGRGVYAQRGPDLLVAESRLWEVLQPDFRSRALVLDDPAGANTVQIGALSLERQPGGWRVVAPQPALADPERVAALLHVLESARAESFSSGTAQDGDPISFDGHPQARIRWQGCESKPQVFRNDGAVLCFGSLELRPRVDDLREPHLTSLRLDDLDAVDLEVAGKKLSLRHADHAWRMTAPPEAAGPADDAAVRERLKKLLELRARAFAAPGPQPLGRLRLAGPAGEVSLALAKSGNEVTALRAAEDSALILPAKSLGLFDPDPLLLRSKRVDTFRRDQVTSLTADGAELKNPALLEALSDLHAERVQPRAFVPAHTLRVMAAGVAHTYQLGPRDADGCLVRSSDTSPAFVIAPATCQLLYAPFTPPRLPAKE